MQPTVSTTTDTERALAGALLLDAPAAAREIVATITAADVQDPCAHEVIRLALAHVAAGRPFDLLIAATELRSIVPTSELEAMADACPTVAHAGYYADRIRAESSRRRLGELYQAARAALDRGDTDPRMLAEELRERLSAVLDCMTGSSASCTCDYADAILAAEVPAVVALLAEIFGPGDVVQVNGSSKSRKTFMLLQLALCLVTGAPFLGIAVTPGPVVYLNLEIRPEHFRRRLQRMARALGVGPDLPHKLIVLHGRGRTPEAALSDVRSACRRIRANVIILDPVYKLAPTGDENGSADAKQIVAVMDRLAEDSKAAIVYAHHTAKGSPGDRKAVDRGAGHNTLSRAFDAALSIMPHASEPDAYVTEWTLRNYAPREPAAVRWLDDHFVPAQDVTAEPETTRSRMTNNTRPGTDTASLVSKAVAMLADKPLPLATFKSRVQDKLNIGERRAGEIVRLVRESEGIAFAKEKRFGGTWYIGPEDAVRKLVEQ